MSNVVSETNNLNHTNKSVAEKTKSIVIIAVMIALTTLFTAFVNVRLPIAAVGGLIHLGNVPLFLAAILFGKKEGAIAGGVGMALFDLLSGWTLYAPCTFIVCGLMGFVVGLIVEKKKNVGFAVLGMIAALAIKIAGYYLYEAIIYHSFVVPVASIPGNVLQVVLAMMIVLIIMTPLQKVVEKLHLAD